MRDIPGLTPQVVARAGELAAKAEQARRIFRTPHAEIPMPKVRDGIATIRLYDYIDREGGEWGISAEEFALALDAIEGAVTGIELHINSGGGSVWDGLAILNNLRSQVVPITARVDGVAASAASFVAAACDRTLMMPNSKMMVHDALGICIGQAADMREYAEFLDESSQNIAAIYAARGGGTVEEWRERMTAKGLLGQWYGPDEAVEAGLADEVVNISRPTPATADDDEPQAKDEPPASRASYWERRHRMNQRRTAA